MEPSSPWEQRPPGTSATLHSQSAAAAAAVGSEGVTSDVAEADDTAKLARFEFSDEGTKILMVEWSSAAAAVVSAAANATAAAAAGTVASVPGSDSTPVPEPEHEHTTAATTAAADDSDSASWDVSWPGKSTVLQAREKDHDEDRWRVYFLLPRDAAVPATVTVRSCSADGPSFDVKPLPAIFPEALSNADVGRRGVLHTIWAKRRMADLQSEIDAEMRTNAESVGLQMAVAEKQWIEESFLQPAKGDAPVSARSPHITGPLGDKLKGLRLATSPADLAPSPTANTFTGAYPSIDQGADFAVSSFSEASTKSGASKSDQRPTREAGGPSISKGADDEEDDLFAKPLSPRSPDMKRSPFSAL